MTHSVAHPSPVSITAVVLARNEAAMIANCLATLKWCDEIIVVDNGSSDDTVALARQQAGVRVVAAQSGSFAELRQLGAKRAKTDWLVYIDADERVTPALADEIKQQLSDSAVQALQFKRDNIMYGRRMRHGNWQKDLVTRAFRRASLQGWSGIVHESPRYQGDTCLLAQPLIHLTHRSTSENLRKTISWTALEAELLYRSELAPVGFLTMLRKGVIEFVRRAWWWGGWRDGSPGLVESLVQGINKILIYIQVWELQRRPTLPEVYDRVEQDVARQWRQR
ncbi:MAG: hypothetical protein COU69_01555 [Candidatus Pacebacteria bacterium CG10_big_fil_rev_8_21_14_0_10_56_10]|nr:MAG: hypothetical protein COU69_01555 [Candidatus Pacebacteria bacterium CG10_big_fil_rev_8_21_14_0_10_56_10]